MQTFRTTSQIHVAEVASATLKINTVSCSRNFMCFKQTSSVQRGKNPPPINNILFIKRLCSLGIVKEENILNLDFYYIIIIIIVIVIAIIGDGFMFFLINIIVTDKRRTWLPFHACDFCFYSCNLCVGFPVYVQYVTIEKQVEKLISVYIQTLHINLMPLSVLQRMK